MTIGAAETPIPTNMLLKPSTTITSVRCPLVIDVRTQVEWLSQHAPCAYHLPFQTDYKLMPKLAQLTGGDRSYPVHLYCASGNRAGQAKQILESRGWTNVVNAGGLVTDPKTRRDTLRVCKNSTCAPFYPPHCPMLIDVRTTLEWDIGHDECASRLEIHEDPSLDILILQLANSPRNHSIRVECACGKRAKQARQILIEKKDSIILVGSWTTSPQDALERICDWIKDDIEDNTKKVTGFLPQTGILHAT